MKLPPVARSAVQPNVFCSVWDVTLPYYFLQLYTGLPVKKKDQYLSSCSTSKQLPDVVPIIFLWI